MKRNAPRSRLSAKRKPTATRPSRSTIQKKSGSAGGGTSSRKARSSGPTYFSLLKDVEHALKYEHMDGASLQKLKRHMEKRYGKPFDAIHLKMLRSAVKRLHKKGRIKKHPTSNLYKFKPPIVPAHHIFGTAKQRREGREQARAQARARPSRRQSGAKRSRPNRSSKPTRRRR
ncbi:hypothetical protein KC19_12G150700 [Ceratodon purpureus]|uniref:H15 domain-containing protein n=1 Tax=Ceratodon purpureus TaxID=3225 RepID=A0A8T0G9Y8_CERPU|nr:hypothetical protein KC19_12G150700 [Ceratodon purpureus]